MELKTGHLLAGGRYRIECVLGQGGFGITYRARNTIMKCDVAIKEFFVKDFCNRSKDTDCVVVATESKVELINKLRKKFVEEAQSLFRMNHQGIVRVTDLFEENGTSYYVMEYINGCSLGTIMDNDGKLSERDALGYIRQVADALRFVHSHNRLHLDVKPQNIMVDNNGKAVLIDFGVSKQYDEANGENTSTLLGCTPGYAPIEQIGSGVAEFHAATDVYSLGATLYKLITGKTPVSANKRASSIKLKELTFPDDITPATRAAIGAAMRLYVENRPQSIDEFLALLDGSSAGVIPNVSEKSQTQDDDGETVVSDAVILSASEESHKHANKEILHSVQDDDNANKEKFGNGNDKPAAGVISNDSKKSQHNGGKPPYKKWIAIAAVALLAVAAVISGVCVYNSNQQHTLIPILDENGKYGYVDQDGKEVVEYKYDYARSFKEGMAAVTNSGKSGFINQDGTEVVECKYDGVWDFSEGMAKVRNSGKYGFVNQDGIEVVECKYDEALSFCEGLARIISGGKRGFIDKNGKEVVECKYDEAFFFSEGLACIKSGGKWGFIDNNGKEVVECKYDGASYFYEGLALVKSGGKWGFIDQNGKEVVECKYDEAWSFSEGLAFIKSGGKWGFIDQNGKEVVECKYDRVLPFSEGLACIKSGGKWGFIDQNGKEVVECKYDGASSFSEGLARIGSGGKWGSIDQNGKEVVECKYDGVSSFKEGMAFIESGGKRGFIDQNGKEVVECKYDNAWPFSEGLALVERDGDLFYIDKTGKEYITERKAREDERKRLEYANTHGSINGHEYVDLALPSGLKWATCNVGATKPEENGFYYAWGETSAKNSYTMGNSTMYNKNIVDICGNQAYDVARSRWGSSWRLPTKAEFQELLDNCTLIRTTQKGHNGYKLTSKKNGNSIFFPAAGWRGSDSVLKQKGERGLYWSAIAVGEKAYSFYVNKTSYGVNDYHFYFGFSVRPVSGSLR